MESYCEGFTKRNVGAQPTRITIQTKESEETQMQDRTLEQIQKAIAVDLYVEGYHSWDMYDEEYLTAKTEMESRYNCKLSDLEFDNVIDRLKWMEDE